MTYTLILIISYLIGSIPNGFIVGKFFGIDIRKFGSKNIGATNVYRVLGLKPALLVFLTDAAKGVAGATLTASDNHHAAGSQLMSIAGNTGDLRQKEYDISNLLANPSTATDQSTGLQASTVSIIEIDCALEELAALASPDNTVSNTGAIAASTRTNQMLVLVRLITGHCYEAFAQGYPSADFAVFARSSKQ